MSETVFLSDLPPEVIAFFTNGCGPRKPRPGEQLKWWKRILRSIRPPQWHSSASCCQHDLTYLVGGTSDDRRDGDYQLRRRMIEDAKTRPWWQQPWYRGQAWLYWAFVRIFGRFLFHYSKDGKKRTAADIINLYHKMVNSAA
jgi:hypothetical protein